MTLKIVCNNLSLIFHVHTIPQECMHDLRVKEETMFMYEMLIKFIVIKFQKTYSFYVHEL